MEIENKGYRAVWFAEDGHTLEILNQTKLPFGYEVIQLTNMAMTAKAIREMWVCGMPLVNTVAAYGVALGMKDDPSDENLARCYKALVEARPTASSLKWALERTRQYLLPMLPEQREIAAYRLVAEIADRAELLCKKVGDGGLDAIRNIAMTKPKDEEINIFTHCNMGWLATVDWGVALVPIYQAYDAGLNIHVWINETEANTQSLLTAFELGMQGIPHTVTTMDRDKNLIQRGGIDLCVVGTNHAVTSAQVRHNEKIACYLKGSASQGKAIPTYVVQSMQADSGTIFNGVREIRQQRVGLIDSTISCDEHFGEKLYA
jgi:methylthioribose-1-phosphate isomerase